MLRSALCCLSIGAALTLVSGCGGSGPNVVPVSGTVTRGGKPVASLHINFMPEAGRPSWGTSDDQGKFTLNYDPQLNGAEVGKHKVFVTFRHASPKVEMDFLAGKKTFHPDKKAIEEKYGRFETTPLVIEIKSAGQPVLLELE